MRQLEPGRDVGVVVEPRRDDLVALPQLASDGPREHEVEVGHARPEDRLARRAAEEAACGLVRGLHELARAPARLELPSDVCVGLAQVAGDRVDHLVRHLCPGRAVEERIRPSQRGEPRSDRLDVERHLHVLSASS